MEKRKIICIVLLALTYSACAQTEYDRKLKSLYRNSVKTIKPVDLKELVTKGEKITILDTRAPEEFNVSHLKGAQFLNYDSYSTEDLKKLPKNEKIIVYCSVGYRSERVGEKLQKLGYHY